MSKQPKRKWRPETERDRSMRAYEQNPRARKVRGLFDSEPIIHPIPGQFDVFGNEVK